MKHPDAATEKAFRSLNWPNGFPTKIRPENGLNLLSGRLAGAARVADQPTHTKGRTRRCRIGVARATKRSLVRTGTVLESSRLPLKKWVWAIYLEITSLKGISSMKLYRDIGVTQKTAWHMLHRIRETFSPVLAEMFASEVEVDETFVGGKEGNKHADKKLHAGRGGRWESGRRRRERQRDEQGEGAGCRKDGMPKPCKDSSWITFCSVRSSIPMITRLIRGLEYVYDHGTVKHSVGEYVDEQIHVNGMESFWATLKRSINGTYHQMSKKHLQRYVNQFCGKHNVRNMDTMHQMEHVAACMVGKRLMYKKPDLMKKHKRIADGIVNDKGEITHYIIPRSVLRGLMPSENDLEFYPGLSECADAGLKEARKIVRDDPKKP